MRVCGVLCVLHLKLCCDPAKKGLHYSTELELYEMHDCRQLEQPYTILSNKKDSILTENPYKELQVHFNIIGTKGTG